jgi:hypothetical protein
MSYYGRRKMDNNELIKDMSRDIKELVKQGAEHNVLLKTHEARSLELQSRQEILGAKVEERLKPLEVHIHWVNVVLKTAGAILVAVLIKLASDLFT